MQVQDHLNALGGFGKFQKMMLFWVCLISALNGFVTFMPSFLMSPPQMKIDFCPEDHATCEVGNLNQECPTTVGNGEGETDTHVRWHFAKPDLHLTEEFSLICERASFTPFAASMYFVGMLVGGTIPSVSADSTGRMPWILFCTGLNSLALMLSLVKHGYTYYCVLRLLTGFCQAALATLSCVAGMEFCSSDHYRSLVMMYAGLCYTAGTVSLALMYRYVPWYQAIVGAACLLSLLCFSLAFSQRRLETPGFSMTQIKKGLIDDLPPFDENDDFVLPGTSLDCRKYLYTLSVIKEWNGADDEAYQLIAKEMAFYMRYFKTGPPLAPSLGTFELFNSWSNLRGLLIHVSAWFSAGVCYFGLQMNASKIPGDVYWNFILLALAEVPALVLTRWLMDHPLLGRKGAVILTYSGVAIFSFIAQSESVRLIFSVLGKLCTSIIYTIIYVYLAEYYPTRTRGAAFGVVNVAARTGGILSPYTVELPENMTFLLYSTLALLVALSFCFLPNPIS